MLWSLILKRYIKKGHIVVIDSAGRSHEFGQVGAMPSSTIRLTEKWLPYKFLLNGEFYMGEAYMDGKMVVERGTLHDVLDVVGMNMCDVPEHFIERMRVRAARLLQKLLANTPAEKAKANVAHHYDLNGTLYKKFLDEDMQYSCAYFTARENSLEQAQYDKKRHIAAKLLLEPGMEVLDIGCGWGGMAIFLAREYGVRVTGLTLSEEQHKVARERAAAAGLSDRVHFHLRDYRDEKGAYDRIVSVGMFEHVGMHHFPEFFETIRDRLKADGVALLHSIGRKDGPGLTGDWITKYIFPGGYAPALSEVLPTIEKTGLWATDIEVLRMHYAYTLQEWLKRFHAHRAEIAALYDERFCRMWEFYLCACEVAFSRMYTMVFQIQLTKDIFAVPLTRDYMFEAEREARQVQAA